MSSRVCSLSICFVVRQKKVSWALPRLQTGSFQMRLLPQGLKDSSFRKIESMAIYRFNSRLLLGHLWGWSFNPLIPSWCAKCTIQRNCFLFFYLKKAGTKNLKDVRAGRCAYRGVVWCFCCMAALRSVLARHLCLKICRILIESRLYVWCLYDLNILYTIFLIHVYISTPCFGSQSWG